MSEPIGIILEGNTTPYVAAMEKADAVTEVFGKSVETASVTTRKAMLAMVTATDAESKALAALRLSSAQAMDTLNAQAAAQTKAAKAAVAAAAEEKRASEAATAASRAAAEAEVLAWQRAAEQVAAADARKAASAKAAADAQVRESERAAKANALAADRAAAASRVQRGALVGGTLTAAGAGGAVAGVARVGVAADGAAGKLKAMAGVGAIALAGIGYESAKAAVTFEQSTTRLQTQAHVSTTDLKIMSDGVLKLAGSTATGPNALAEAIYHVASAGYVGAGSLTVMKQAALGAKVGNADLNDTTNALVGTMKALDAPAADAGKTMASLNAIVGAGKMTMDDLNGALATGIVPTAKAFGVSLDSVGAALAYMTDRGTPADSAATRLRMSLTLMADPATKAAKALSAIGLSGPEVTAASQAMADALHKANLTTTKMAADLRQPDGIAVALEDLKKHLHDAGISANAATAILAKAFGGGKSDAAIVELINNVDGVRQKFDQVRQGASLFGQDIAQTQKTAAYQLGQVKADVEVLGVAIGRDLLPAIKDVTGWMLRNKTAVEAVAVALGVTAVAAVGLWVGSVVKGVVTMGADFATWVAGVLAGDTAVSAATTAAAAESAAAWQVALADSTISVEAFTAAADANFASIAATAETAAASTAAVWAAAFSSILAGAALLGVAIGPKASSQLLHGDIGGAGITVDKRYGVLSGLGLIGGVSSGLGDAVTRGARGVAQADAPGNANIAEHNAKLAAAAAADVVGSPQWLAAQQAKLDAAARKAAAASDHGTGGYAPSGGGAGGGGGGGRKAAVPAPYAAFTQLERAFGSTEQTAAMKQSNMTTEAQVVAAEKADRAMQKLAEAHLKHAQTLVKTAKTTREKAAASVLLAGAHGQLNTATKLLVKAQHDAKTIAAAAAKAATELADAKLEATSNMQDQATADAVHIKEAKEAVDAATKGTVAYYQAVTAYNAAVATGAKDAADAAAAAKQAQLDLANAMIEAGIDYSDPLSGLRAAVAEAKNTLAGDTPGTTQFYLDTAALNRANQDLVNALSQNTTATDANTTGMTGGPLNELPGYAALRAGANAEAYLGGSGGGAGISGPRTSRNGGSQAPIYITIDVQTNDADAIAKALNVRLSRAGSAIRL